MAYSMNLVECSVSELYTLLLAKYFHLAPLFLVHVSENISIIKLLSLFLVPRYGCFLKSEAYEFLKSCRVI